MKKKYLLFFIVFSSFQLSAQLTGTGGLTAQQLAQIIVGSGTTVSNATLNCPYNASGSFDGTASNIGLNEGVLLTSGSINYAPGPNTSGSSTQDNGTNGDSDLDNISSVPTFDACVLEFDVLPTCDTLKIEYVFASEEYNEYVCGTVNDAFGIFISGPGITGTQNIALIPGTTTGISINSVNIGSPGGSYSASGCISLSYSSYFNDNTGGATIGYDGFTVPLTAKAVVQPCQTYHLKIAIGDGGDRWYDSGVFIASVSCTPTIGVVFSDTSTVEGCGDLGFYISKGGDLTSTTTFVLSTYGTATDSIDFSGIPDTLVMLPGDSLIYTPITIIEDSIVEGTEELNVIVSYWSDCNTMLSDTLTFTLNDNIVVNPLPDTGLCTVDVITLDANFPSAVSYSWVPSSGLNDSSLPNPTATIDTTITYTLTITDTNGCPGVGEVTITVADKILTIPSPDTIICYGDQVTIWATASNGTAPYTYIWDNSLPSADTNYVAPVTETIYTVYAVDSFNCVGDDTTLTISLAENLSAEITPYPDSVICPGNSVILSVNVLSGVEPFIYYWDNNIGTVTDTFTVVYPVVPTTYTVRVTDNCAADFEVSQGVSFHPLPIVDFLAPDNSGCVPYAVEFYDNTSPAPASYLWNFGDSLSSTNTSTSVNPTHTYTEPGTYTVNLQAISTEGCLDSTSYQNIVEVYNNPIADFSYFPGAPTMLNPIVSFFDASYDSYTWLWDFGDNSTFSTSSNPDHIYADTGKFEIKLYIENENQCTDSISYYVTVRGSYTIYAPNTFTPNADDKNDGFIPKGTGLNEDEFILEIFDRWGALVYATEDINEPWLGNNKQGTAMPIDTYIWKLKTRDINGKYHSYIGHVNLSR